MTTNDSGAGKVRDWPSKRVTLFASATSTMPTLTTCDAILNGIRDGRWREAVESIRQTFRATRDHSDVETATRAIATLKRTLPAVIFAGEFSYRKAEALIRHSRVMVLDFDHLGSAVASTKALLAADAHVLAIFVSPSGDGLKILVPVEATDAAMHTACFRQAEQHFADEYGLNVDAAGKDVSRLCFVSYDPELIMRAEAEAFGPLTDDEPAAEPRQESPGDQQKCHDRPNPADVRAALDCIPPDSDYRTWLFVGMALHASGEPVETWDCWSARGQKYNADECSAKWRSFHEGAIGPGTLFFIAKKHGWRPTTGRQFYGTENDTPDSFINAEVEEQQGPPWFETMTEQGPKFGGINEAYWAGLHHASHTELFEPHERLFYRYDPATGLFATLTIDCIKGEIGEAILEAGRKRCPALIRARTDNRLTAIIGHLRGIAEERDAFAAERRRFIHLANGVLEIDASGNFALRPFSAKYRSRNQSPFAYNENATCPRFIGELIEPAVSREDALLIQKHAGLCLLGHNLIQRLLILDGEAGRGKTQLAVALQHLVGLANVTQLRTAHLAERFELFRFLRKTLLVGADVPANFLETAGASVLKSLVGGDILDAEQKGSNACFPFHGTFNVLITSNARLKVRLEGDVGAWRRRLLIVRYEAPPPKVKIPDFGKKLVEAEGSGILNWALQGLQALLRDVNETGDVRLTPRQSNMVDALLLESDSLRHFLNIAVRRKSGSDLTATEIVERYAEYCPTQGWVALPITVVQRQLESLMLELFATVKVNDISRGGKGQRGFRNVGWSDGSDGLS